MTKDYLLQMNSLQNQYIYRMFLNENCSPVLLGLKNLRTIELF